MSDEEAVGPGPFKTVPAFGGQVPVYILKYDKRGSSASPLSEQHLVSALAGGGFTHVLVYSHGWNNDFPAALRLYEAFLEGVSAMAAERGGLDPATFRPVFVGLSWPSTALTFGSEAGPVILGSAAAPAQHEFEDFLGALPEERRSEAAALLGASTGVETAEAERLAEIVAEALSGGAELEDEGPPRQAADLVATWRNPEPAQQGGGFARFGTADGAATAAPQAAGSLGSFDPRWIVRLATVLLMKDRAGVVGAGGVADLLGRILGESDSRLCLVGHSYGTKLLASALAVRAPPRPADFCLFLQPAVSRLCFAADLGSGREGGFRRLFDPVRQPIHLTWSTRDIPLRRIFHLAVRRASDVGELQIAAEVSRYAALGGYGPAGCLEHECLDLPLPAAGVPIGADPALSPRVIALNGSSAINGHGDVNRPELFWLASELLK
jgi:hypothetical protein